MPKEHRHHTRYEALISLDVYDMRSGEVIGQLFDISHQGLRLHSSQVIPNNASLSLGVSMLHQQRPDPESVISAQCIWRIPAEQHPGWYYGFRLLQAPSGWLSIVDSVRQQLALHL